TTVRSTPVVLLPRREVARWTALVDATDTDGLSVRAQRVYGALLRHGAMFFDELAADAHLLGVELENALGELVAAGLVNADSFAGLRALVKPAAKRNAHHGRRKPRGFGPLVGGMADAGRWAVLRRVDPADEQESAKDDGSARTPRAVTANAARRPPADPALLEHVADVLLRRYGVVCWQVLAREAAWLPPWRDLLRVLHRMEARGNVRGGRFVTGLSGEQFALPEAVALLREVRRRGERPNHSEDETVCIAAVDPLNLVGSVLPGEKVPAVAGNRVAFRDGVPVAALVAGRFEFRGEFDEATRAALRAALARGA
ncbi:ATP-dependent DNA helicase, partial [Paraburkholderia sp. Ac-20347]|nr:ATP-dependent DNA helicase [Paraburkholderia sp. Ac-20347]